jgi:hypothetical protein
MNPYIIPDDVFKKTVAETSTRIYNQHFAGRMAISGEELLEVSPYAQVNRFILFQIYQEWTIQMAKLSSPYFDFKNPEVKQALQGFQNYLSQFIRIEKKDFKPILDKAVYNSIRLILHPIEVFNNFFFMNQDQIPLSYIERYTAYFSDFDFIISSIVAYHKKHGLDKVEKSLFFEKVNRVVELYEQRVGHSIDNYRSIIFHKLTHHEISQLITTATSVPVENEEFPGILSKLESLKKEANYPLNEIEEPQPLPTLNFIAEPEPVVVNLNGNGQHYGTPVLTNEPIIERLINQPEVKEQPARLVDRLVEQQPRTNVPIMTAINLEQIPMHKQFQFISKVFAGNRNRMTETIKAINQFTDYSEAENYMNTRILNMPEVDREDPVVVEFMQLIKNAKN